MASIIEKFQALPKKQQIQILVVVPLLVVGGCGFYTKKNLDKLGDYDGIPSILRRPGTEESIGNLIKAKQTESDGLDATLARGNQVRAELKRLEKDINAAEARLPGQAEKSEMSAQIGRLASQIGAEVGGEKLTLTSIQINEEAPSKGGGGSKATVQTIIYVVAITGGLDSMIQFIDAVEKNERFMTVDSFQIQPGAPTIDPQTKAIKPAVHQATMRLKTYVYTSGRGKGRS